MTETGFLIFMGILLLLVVIVVVVVVASSVAGTAAAIADDDDGRISIVRQQNRQTQICCGESKDSPQHKKCQKPTDWSDGIQSQREDTDVISKFSVKRPYTVIVGVILVIVLGVVSFTRMTTDLLPDMNLPYALVITTDVGASPEEVEADVTAPVEASMATTSSIKNVSSVSYDNYSMVILEYEQSANMDSILIEIQQKLDQLEGSFSDSVGKPMIMQIDPDMMPVMVASADVEGMDESEVSSYVENEFSPALESVEGVASVSATGVLEESVQVTMDQDKIDALNEKIQKKIEEQFADAQKELDDASAELENGEKKLGSGKSELANQVSAAANQIENGKIQAYVGASELKTNMTMMTEAKKIMEKAIPALQQLYNDGIAARQQLEALKNMLTPEQQEAIAGGSAQIEQQANAQLATINESIAAWGQQLESLGIKVQTLDDLPYAIADMTQKLAEINTGIATMQEAQKQVDAGKIALDEASAQLTKNQIEGILQLSEATAQLADAKNQLAQGQSQLDAAKDSAKESADLNQILTVDMLGNLLAAQNFSMPAGYVGEGENRYMVRVGDKLDSVDELKQVVLIDLGLDGIGPVCLSDVAAVELVNNAGESYSKVNGNPAIMLSIEKQTGYSTGDVTKRIQQKLKAMEADNPALHTAILMNQGIYIDIIVQSVLENMIVGALLSVIVLILFLKDIRPTLVIACSIPLSVIFAVVLMYFSNISLNIISLSGLALGIGMLVDNSIVVIENIYRLRSEGYSIKKAAVEGAGGVTGAIIASTLTTVCVFVPIVFTEGITRQLFVDIALTITFTLTASLIVALTFVPMMAAGLLKNPKEVRHAFFEKVQQGYAKLLELALRFKPVVFIGVTVLLVTSALAAYSRGFSFMDMNMETDQLTVTVAAKDDEKLTFEELCERADEVTEKIAGIDGVETIGAIAGGDSALMSMGGSSDSVTMYLLLEEDSSVTTGEITAQIAELTKDMDCQVDTDNSASDMSSFLGSGITVQIKGSDLGTLQELAGKVAGVVEAQEGTVDVDDGLDNTTQSYTIHVDKEKAAEYGMTTAQVFQLVYAKLASQTAATTISAGVQDYEVYVRSEEQANVTLDDIKNLTFSYEDKMAQLSGTGSNGEKETDEKLSEDTKDTGDAKDIEDTEDTGDTGDTVKEIPLTEIATFEAGSSLNAVSRDSQTRYISVTAGVDDTHNVTLVANALMKELNKIDLPEGYSIEMTGEDEMIADAMQQLYLMLILAVVFIYLIMVAQFQSFLSPFIIMFTIPLAFTGGLFALFFTGNEISVVAMIGFVMLAGIIVNNGIVMVDYINQLRRGGMTKKEAILNSAKTRLRPILMTALTTILSMSTMALGLGDGSEMMQPMAIVTEGGLIYGTLLTLFVVPCIYDAFNREKNMVEEEL